MKRLLAVLIAIAAPAFATMYDTSNGRNVTVANGVSTVYFFSFPVDNRTDVQATVTLNGIAQIANFTATINADQINSPGGSVTFTSAPANGATVQIQRTQTLTQTTIYNPYNPFPAKTTERTFDSVMRKVQQVSRDLFDLATKEAADISNVASGGTPTVNLMAPVGTGSSAAISLADRFGNIPTIKDFGCIGTGITDDTICLNNAGASGKRVLFTPGTYKATTSVQLAAGTVFTGVDAGTTIITFSGAPNFVVDAIALTGVGAGLENMGINVTAGDYRRIVDHRANFTFTRRCRINTTTPDIVSPNYGYTLWVARGFSLYGVVLEGNDIQGTAFQLSDGMQISDTPGIRILNNRIHDYNVTQIGDLRFTWGIYVSARTPDALIQGNIIENSNISGIHKNGDIAGDSPGMRIVNNTIHNVTCTCLAVNVAGGAVVQGNWLSTCDMPLDVSDSPYAKVIGNHLENVVTRAAGAISANKPLLQLAGTETNVVIQGNTFGVKGDGLRGIDNTTSEADALIIGNQFLPGSPNLPIDSTGVRTIVSGNSFSPDASSTNYVAVKGANSIVTNNVVNNPTNAFGINIGGTGSLVENNIVIGGKNCVFVSAGTGIMVKNNVCTGQSTTVIADSGTSTVKRGNRYTSGASQGVAALVAGTVTVNTAEILTGDTVTLSRVALGAGAGTLSLGAIVNGTSFVINSSNGADTGTVAWEIIH